MSLTHLDNQINIPSVNLEEISLCTLILLKTSCTVAYLQKRSKPQAMTRGNEHELATLHVPVVAPKHFYATANIKIVLSWITQSQRAMTLWH